MGHPNMADSGDQELLDAEAKLEALKIKAKEEKCAAKNAAKAAKARAKLEAKGDAELDLMITKAETKLAELAREYEEDKKELDDEIAELKDVKAKKAPAP